MATSSNPKQSSGSGNPQQAVKFGRRTASGRMVNLSRDDDSDASGEYAGQGDYINYTVMMPPTPDNQPDTSKLGATSSRFASESQQQKDGGGGGGAAKFERRVSVLNSVNNKSMLCRSQTQDFDHNRWLFETKGTYGIGNAYWQDENSYGEDSGMSMSDFMDKPWKPLTRKVSVGGGVLSPYRYISLCMRQILFCFSNYHVSFVLVLKLYFFFLFWFSNFCFCSILIPKCDFI